MIGSVEGSIMSTTSSDSGLPPRDGEATPQEKSEPQPSNGIPSEMQRQMEAAKERMQKYHAVYRRPSEEPGA
jgi:hypothetical protein